MNRAQSLAIALAAIALPAVPAPAAQTTLVADRDNTLIEYLEGLFSNGVGSHFFAGRTGQGFNQDTRRGLVRFDAAAAIPAGSTITGVTVTFHMSRTQAGPKTVSLHRLLRDWGEGTSDAAGQEGGGANSTPGDATWLHTFYDTEFWSNPGAEGDYVVAPSAATTVTDVGFYSWTGAGLVADVQAWVDGGADQYGWIVIGDESTGSTSKRFDTHENAEPTFRPQLTIDFIAAGPVGACCLDGGTCQVVDAGTCATMGGAYEGDDTTCTPNPCPAPTGACCLPGGTCTVTDAADCAVQGGSYAGDGVSCTPDPCALELEKFVDPLPIPAVAMPTTGVPGGAAHYDIEITRFTQTLHRDLPPTLLWGYEGSYPGPTIEAARDVPITVTWTNDLRDDGGELLTVHDLPVDLCMHGPDHAGPVPLTVVHLHGGHVRAEDDGYPENTFLPGGGDTYDYPNNQRPATLWYHDHALGITRLNVYLGLAGFYLVRDADEAALGLPDGAFEIPMVIQDRSFNVDGSLHYPAAWQDHFFGDTILVNGKVWPYLEVTRGKYRFRVLNGSNSRTYTLALSNGATFELIGADGGLLESPVPLTEVTLTPAERADIVVDFRTYPVGTTLELVNSAPAPFPGSPGVGVVPDVMEFRVVAGAAHTAPLPASLGPMETLDPGDAVRIRTFELRKLAEPCAGTWWLINELGWDDITEYPRLGTTEIWEFVNLSGMVHPMHMHLDFFQVLGRQDFDVVDDAIVPVGPVFPPAPAESGWKDTVAATPQQITRVIVRFEDYAGLFAYHCHILEHEDHEMMRQFRALCAGDTNADDVVDVADLVNVILSWSTPGPAEAMGPWPDLDVSGTVDVTDLVEVILSWGPCE